MKGTTVGGRRAAVIAMALGLVLSACGDEETAAPQDRQRQPSQIIYGYHTVETHRGEIQWELHGRTGERYPGEEELQLAGVEMIFYADGVKDATLTSLTGRVNENTRNMTARGNVLIVSEDGRTLSSEVLHWDNSRELIHSEHFVRATDDDQVLTGYGLETDPEMTDLQIKRQVKGDAPVDSEPEDEEEKP